MDATACYAATLQLKQLAERRLAERRLAERRRYPDEAVAWSAAVDYFEDQLQLLHRPRKASELLDQPAGRIDCDVAYAILSSLVG